jgi:hypothetical protein
MLFVTPLFVTLFLATAIYAADSSARPRYEVVVLDRLCKSEEYLSVCEQEGLKPMVISSQKEAEKLAAVVAQKGVMSFWVKMSNYNLPTAVWNEDKVFLGMGRGKLITPVCRLMTREELIENFELNEAIKESIRWQ